MMTRIEPEKIERQAKEIMDSFLKELGSVSETQSFGLQREKQTRTPRATECDEAFRQAFLDNAPKVKDNQLIMERKHW